jgi:hypothetical protein
METHIKAIIEEDLKAQETYRLAEEKVSENLAAIHKEKSRIQNEVWDKEKKHVEAEKVKLTGQLKEAQAQREIQYHSAFKVLEDKFKKDTTLWHKTIFNRCIKKGE